MFLTEDKLQERLEELEPFRYRDSRPVNSFLALDDDGEIGLRPPAIGENHKEMRLGDHWEGRDTYKWLQAAVTFPAEWHGKRAAGIFRFGKTGGGTNSGFESLLYVNGVPYQGVDSNHEEVLFKSDVIGKETELSFRMWTGLEGGGPRKVMRYQLSRAEICLLDEKVDDFYYTALAMHQTILELPEADPNRSALLILLDESFRLLDWTVPGDGQFYESCYLAHEYVTAGLERLEKHHPVTVHCVGHTHIDVAWLWQLKHTREKAARSFSTVLRLMEEYPDYLFLQSQPQLYEYIKHDYPDIYEGMKARIKGGQWEAEGGMWLEADCNIPSGESLVRQILVGKRFLKEEFGVDCKVLWLPDVFGYSWALPQILKKSGIDAFMTTKISWNQYNRMPHDTFYWKGIDGTELLTHFISTPEPWNPEDSWFYTYNGRMTARTVNGTWKGYRNKAMNKELLLSYGYGDGGGGVNREMLEMRRKLDKMPGIPHVKEGKAGDYFRKLQETVENTKQYVHRWDGELYLEYHRGTYTSQAFMKRENRKLELALRDWELFGVLHTLKDGWEAYPAEAILAAWKIVLRNQFHDIIPGSSIREVYEDAAIEYREAWELIRSHFEKAEAALFEPAEHTYTLYNSGLWEEGQVALIPYDQTNCGEGVFFGEGGRTLAAQKSPEGWRVFSEKLKPFAGQLITFAVGLEQEPASMPFSFENKQLSTPFYDVSWDENGHIKTLFDKEAGRSVLARGAKGNVLQLFEDRPLAHDAWDIDIFYQEKMTELDQLVSFEVKEMGPIRIVLQMKWRYHLSTVTQDAIFYSHTKRIDFQTDVDWHERRKLLKAAFPVDIRSTEATFDIQFGNVKRPTHWNTSWDMAKFETVGHHWADLSETGYGVSLLNDCKYGYDVYGNTLRLSLLKSPMHPDTEADQGEHRFTYSLYPHLGDWRESGTHREAWQLNSPLHVFPGVSELADKPLIQADCRNIHISAVKKAEDCDGIIIRFHEFEGRRGMVTLSCGLEVESWQETDLMEKPVGAAFKGNALSIAVTPYEIKTLLVRLRQL